jgi:ribokinase
MTDIVVFGSYNHDILIAVDSLPAPGETRLGRGFSEAPGGKGANQAVQAARCGAAVAFIGAVGEDARGELARRALAEAGVDISRMIPARGAATGVGFVQVAADGGNCIIVCPGVNSAITAEDARAAAPALSAARLVMVQLELPLPAVSEALTIARRARVTTLLNAAPAPGPEGRDLLNLTDILVANETEFATLAGGDPNSAPEIGALKALAARLGHAAIVTLGAQGAWMARRTGEVTKVSAPRVEAVDTTGAGDAFCGAFAAALLRTGDLDQALREGVAAGSLACTRPGAIPSFADAAAIRSLAAQL